MKNYELTIKRNDGSIDKVEKEFAAMPPKLKAKIIKANADAGRGEILSIEDITPAPAKKSKSSRPTLCPHCGTYCYGDCQSN